VALPEPLPGGSLYRCRHCQLKFRHPLQDASTYQQMYDNAATETWPADTLRPDWDLIVNHVHEHVPARGKVLDFGCYSGGLLVRLGATFDRHGIEINRAAAKIAAERGNVKVWDSIDAIAANVKFDVIIAADVIEHMQNPKEFVDRLGALLTDDGILILTTGDADNYLWKRFGANWWYCFNPEHVSFLSRKWLDYISKASELSIAKCDLFSYRQLSFVRRVVDTALTYFYGFFPASYIRLLFLSKKLLGRPLRANVPGNGVSADHLLIALTKKPAPGTAHLNG
jgi:2-polyprenyl-3-methyl-5-hydroxy-6-metoxy-1,4-benzoquinol methylase